MFERFTRPKKASPVGTYRVDVISIPEELDFQEQMPIEIRYILKKTPEYKNRIKKILGEGKAIGVRTVLRTPENILQAVHTISVHSQANYIITWLPELLRNKHRPKFTQTEVMKTRERGENLEEAVEVILRDRLRFKKLVLIDEENIGVQPEEQRLMTGLNEVIYPLAIDYSVFRVVADNARERTRIAQGIIKALLIIGPIAHFLEKFLPGAGKVFTASADDILAESAELSALRGSGFTWRELAKRARILVPVFALATWGAFSVEGLLHENKIIMAGVVFGLSAVALSLTTAVQSFFMYLSSIKKVAREGKITSYANSSLVRLALRQDFTNPARLGLLLGAGLAPIMGILGAVSGLMHNGWVLAAIGSTESIVAGMTVLFADYLNDKRFHSRLTKLIR